MFKEIKTKIDKEIIHFFEDIDKTYSIKKVSSLLFRSLKEFSLNPGKRIRPILFIIGYLGFAKKEAKGLYRSAISCELLHNYLLIHDDIIDKSATRRNKPSLHETYNSVLKKYRNIKFSGQDLAIIAGDTLQALSVSALLSIDEKSSRKEDALKKFTEANLYTTQGEFIEMILSLKSIDKITESDIYKVYDSKTAYYTFATPLSIGATLGGASQIQASNLFKYGMSLGRAFQIKDDILGIFGDETKTGKSSLTDLQESKKTLLLWHLYNNSNKNEKILINKIINKTRVTKGNLNEIRELMIKNNTLRYTKNQIKALLNKSMIELTSSNIKPKYKSILRQYSKKTLTV